MAAEIYKGIALPVPAQGRKWPYVKTEEELIRDSVLTILLTDISQRFYVPDFGSRLRELIFEPNDMVLSTLAQEYVRTALGRWEDRIGIINVQTSQDENVMVLVITYVIIRINKILQLPLQFSKDTGAVIVG